MMQQCGWNKSAVDLNWKKKGGKLASQAEDKQDMQVPHPCHKA